MNMKNGHSVCCLRDVICEETCQLFSHHRSILLLRGCWNLFNVAFPQPLRPEMFMFSKREDYRHREHFVRAQSDYPLLFTHLFLSVAEPRLHLQDLNSQVQV